MIRPGQLRERIIVLFAAGILALNYPVLSLFNVDGRLFGVPALFVYVFAVWLTLIVLLMVIMLAVPRRRSGRPPAGG